jgi:hypothetical protein
MTRAAYHEAGHVIAALHLGDEVTTILYVTIDDAVLARDGLLMAQFGNTRTLTKHSMSAFARAIQTLGGPIAEDRYTRQS